MTHLRSILFCLAAACVTFSAQTASAQTDRIYVTGSTKAQMGKVMTVTKDGIVFKSWRQQSEHR